MFLYVLAKFLLRLNMLGYYWIAKFKSIAQAVVPQVVQQDFERRLEELRSSLRREAEHSKQSTEQAMLHMRRMHEAESSSLQILSFQHF